MGLDAVEILMGWEASFGISITDAEAEALRTPRMAVNLIASKLGAREDARQACLTLRTYHRLRNSIVCATGTSRSRVRPEVHLTGLLPRKDRRRWEALWSRSSKAALPGFGWFAPSTVRALAQWLVSHSARELKPKGEPWTRSEIRCVVRSVVQEMAGVENFSDDDDFIRDIGIDR